MSVMTPKFRVSYPNVFKPRLNTMSKKEEFSLTALFPKDADLTVLKDAMKKAIVDKWGADEKKWPKRLRSPFRDQGEREKELDDGSKALPDGYVKGAKFLNLKCYKKPGVIDQSKNDIISPADFYPGCWARATVAAFAYDTAGNQGVSFWLNNIQKVAEGEPFSGRPKAEDEFAAIESDETTADDLLG